MSEDPSRWSQPFAALLGAYSAQIGFGLPSIGGKDSMSGTFNDIDVPPTLVSFAVDVAKEQDIITPELKRPGNKIMVFKIAADEYDLPVYGQVMNLYDAVHSLIQQKAIVSAYALDGKGIAAAVSKMAFGNKLGVTIEQDVCEDCMFSPQFGELIAEVPADKVDLVEETVQTAMREYEKAEAGIQKSGAAAAEAGVQKSGTVAAEAGVSEAGGGHLSYCRVIGEVNGLQKFIYGDTVITMEEAIRAWTGTLEKVFPTVAVESKEELGTDVFHTENVYVCRHKTARPKVFIPVFPGTNCEYDSAKAFERAGADTIVKVFKNLSAEDIRDSVDVFVKAIDQSQIIMFPGGFSAGDEPEGSAKFFATAFRNAKIAEAVNRLLQQRDGLMLGICNGFQALVKLGLAPYGEIRQQSEDSPTLTYNTIGRHISKMVYTKVVTDKSPWLAQAELGRTYCNPASHGEGRFVASKEWLDKLFANGQVATQYVNEAGTPTMDEEWNINGSYMAIEGITSPDGRVLGKMAHSERRGESVAVNIYGEQDMKLFESGVAYFK